MITERQNRIIRRHYDRPIPKVVRRFVDDGLRRDGLLDSDNQYTQEPHDL